MSDRWEEKSSKRSRHSFRDKHGLSESTACPHSAHLTLLVVLTLSLDGIPCLFIFAFAARAPGVLLDSRRNWHHAILTALALLGIYADFVRPVEAFEGVEEMDRQCHPLLWRALYFRTTA